MSTIRISTKKYKIPELVVSDATGKKIRIKTSRHFSLGRKNVARDNQLMVGDTEKKDIKFSTNSHLLLLKDFTRHPIFFVLRLMKTWEINFSNVNENQLPLKISLVNEPASKIWVSRQAIIGGITAQNLDVSLELDYLRAPFTFDLMVRSSDANIGTQYDIYTEEGYELARIEESSVPKLKYRDILNAEIISGRIVTQETSIVPISNYRTEISVHHVGLVCPDHQKSNYRLFKTKRSTGSFKKAIFIGYSASWFHFLIECIPRLMEIPVEIRMECPVVLPDDAPSQILEVCEILTGMEAIRVNLYESIKVEHLILGIEYGVQDPLEFKFRKNKLQEAILEIINKLGESLISTVPSDNVFIKRPKGLFRPLQNEKKIIRALMQRNFQVVSPELMGLKQTVNTFRSAKLIVAESGAAITNVLFAQSGAKLIELYPGKGPMDFWPELASISGVSVSKVMGKSMIFGSRGLARDGIYIPRGKLLKSINGSSRKSESKHIY
jgi:hypothetical protein